MDTENRKKAVNTVGLFVLGLFVIGISYTKGVAFLQNKQNIEDTKKSLNELAAAFSQNDSNAMRTWSKGECLDAWGSGFVLYSTSQALEFCSKGPDKKLGTGDDIRSQFYFLKSREERIEEMKASAEPIVAKEDSEEIPKKSFLSRFKFTWGKK
jgi:hypothetical protein